MGDLEGRPESCAFKFFTASLSAGAMGSVAGAIMSTWGYQPVQKVSETSLLHVGKVRPYRMHSLAAARTPCRATASTRPHLVRRTFRPWRTAIRTHGATLHGRIAYHGTPHPPPPLRRVHFPRGGAG